MSDSKTVTMPQGDVSKIKAFFEADGGRPISLSELKSLSSVERGQLAAMIDARNA